MRKEIMHKLLLRPEAKKFLAFMTNIHERVRKWNG